MLTIGQRHRAIDVYHVNLKVLDLIKDNKVRRLSLTISCWEIPDADRSWLLDKQGVAVIEAAIGEAYIHYWEVLALLNSQESASRVHLRVALIYLIRNGLLLWETSTSVVPFINPY